MRNHERATLACQSGGITILVAMFLLVLLTIFAVSMSRNSLREVIISGTVRQGTEVRNVADNGIEWSCYWVTPDANGVNKAAPDDAAKAFVAQVKSLSASMDLSGETRNIATTGSMSNMGETDGATRNFSLDVIRMGKQQLDMTGGQASTGAAATSKAVPIEMMPDIWSIRSTGTLDYGVTGATFQHIREAWVTAPIQVP